MVNQDAMPELERKQNIKNGAWEMAKVLILAAITVFIVRTFLFKPFSVLGASMEPNFENKQYLIVDELTYRFEAPKRGDVVVFRPPNDEKEFYLKRIIGLPGERIDIREGKITIFNSAHPEGIVLEESYLPGDLATLGVVNTTLGENHYFVLGDNRPNSLDSRRFGAIDKSAIIGRVWIRGLPFSKVGIIQTPNFNF